MISWLTLGGRMRGSINARYSLGMIKLAAWQGDQEEAFESDKDIAFAAMVRKVLDEEGVNKVRLLGRDSIRQLDHVRMAFYAGQPEFEQSLAKLEPGKRAALADIRERAERIGRRQQDKLARGATIKQQVNQWLEDGPVELPPGGLVEWLKDKTPDTWHEVATAFNWDLDLGPLRWIASQPECDIATAMTIYLAGDPRQYDDVRTPEELPEYRRAMYDLLAMIAENVGNGFYTRQEFHCDLSHRRYGFADQQRRVSNGEFVRWQLPESAFGPFAGRKHKSPYMYDSGEIWTQPPRLAQD